MADYSQQINPIIQDVVLVGAGLAPVVWTGHRAFDLLGFLEDMEALGFAIWLTPSAVYVFTGEVE